MHPTVALVEAYGQSQASMATAASVEVRWPDAAGTVTRYTGVLANYEVTLREGDPSPRYRR